MTAVRASAPGKLFLLGEYAVLGGAPALLTAVEQRVVVAATEAKAWRLTATGLSIGTVELGLDGSLPSELSEPATRRLALVDHVRGQVARHFGDPGPALDLLIDSSSFQHGGHKLGLGSSAAVAVALTAALCRARGQELDLNTVFSLADAAHRAAQGGSGSGGDIAASVHGGVIVYSRHDTAMPAVVPVHLPPNVAVFAVSTGTGSSTVELVGRVNDYQLRDPAGYRRDLDLLARLAESTTEALTSSTTFLCLVDDYFHALETLDQNAGAGIVTEKHQEFRTLAAASGAVFKPSGAGGGDLGLVFAKLGSAETLPSAFTEAGALVIPLPTSSDGVRIEPT